MKNSMTKFIVYWGLRDAILSKVVKANDFSSLQCPHTWLEYFFQILKLF